MKPPSLHLLYLENIHCLVDGIHEAILILTWRIAAGGFVEKSRVCQLFGPKLLFEGLTRSCLISRNSILLAHSLLSLFSVCVF